MNAAAWRKKNQRQQRNKDAAQASFFLFGRTEGERKSRIFAVAEEKWGYLDFSMGLYYNENSIFWILVEMRNQFFFWQRRDGWQRRQ